MTPDVNVLVAASRKDHPHHVQALGWIHAAVENLAQGSTLCLQPMVVASFMRLVTNPKIFKQPTPIADALAFVDALLAVPGVEQATLGSANWLVLRRLCKEKRLSGNALPDAWLAAAVMVQGEHLVSFDTDFKRLLPRGQLSILAPQ
jgi:uncharacterized protein